MVQDFGIISKTTTLCYTKEQRQQSFCEKVKEI